MAEEFEGSDVTLIGLAALMIEELEGVSVYTSMIDKAKDPETKALLTHIRTDEKKHVQALLEHINAKAAVALQ